MSTKEEMEMSVEHKPKRGRGRPSLGADARNINILFRLSEEEVALLEKHRHQHESLPQAARRLLLMALHEPARRKGA
jgi:hypothetical protein